MSPGTRGKKLERQPSNWAFADRQDEKGVRRPSQGKPCPQEKGLPGPWGMG